MEQPAPQGAPRLERMVDARPPIVRRLLWAATSGLLAVKLFGGTPATPDCWTASIREAPRLAAEVCERAYLRTGDPWTGARLADAQRRTGNLAVAGALANGLLVTGARADALWVIGMIAATEHRLDTARRALENARALDLAEHRAAEAARDSMALADLAAAR
ncbi:MAG: hypothetical protein ABIY55_07165 [Kofleriaceae bacterium]